LSSKRAAEAVKGGGPVKRGLTALLVVGWVAWLPPGAEAQTPGEVFRKVAPSVVVIRARGHELPGKVQ
jgi:hypothetical protein